MPTASSAADQGAASAKNKLDRARAHLREAAELLDSIQAPPEFAARVQAAHDALEEYRVD